MKKFYVKLARKETIEPEEIILDANVLKKEGDQLKDPSRKFEIPVFSVGFWFALLIIGAPLLFLFGRVFLLNIIEHKAFMHTLEANFLRREILSLPRGIIYDKNLTQLTFNEPTYDVIADKKLLLAMNASARDELFKKLARILNSEKTELANEFQTSPEPKVVLFYDISHKALLILQAQSIPGISLRESFIRQYKDPKSLSHLIGYLGKITNTELTGQQAYGPDDNIGRTGLEEFYERVLRGKSGYMRIERDARGSVRKTVEGEKPENGRNLVLHLDYDLQKTAYELLSQKLAELGLRKAAFVAIDPSSGGIKAMVSLPAFDANFISQGLPRKEFTRLLTDKDKPLFNRVLMGLYPPGSTIKPLLATAALTEKIVTPEQKLWAPEAIYIPNPYIKDMVYTFKDWKFHGWINIVRALAESSNVFFYQVGGGLDKLNGLGIERIKQYLTKFGWSQRLGIDMPGEASGFVPDPQWKEQKKNEAWYIGDTYNASIGQGDITVTPLQLVTAVTAIANGGTLYQPQIVDKLLNNSKEVVNDIQPKIIQENLANPDILKIVKGGMYEVTQAGGTAGLLGTLPVKVGAKTGTAQAGKNVKPHAWLTAFAPLEKPEIAITVLVENGGEVPSPATRVAYEILKWYFQEKSNGKNQISK